MDARSRTLTRWRSAAAGTRATSRSATAPTSRSALTAHSPTRRAHEHSETFMVATPLEVVRTWLQNLLDPEVATRVVAPDAMYVSLNTENAELAKIMPWAGTSHGPQAFLDNLGMMFTRWENQAFN